MAEALTNYEAKKRGLEVMAESAGTVGGKSLNAVAVQAMEEIGIDMSGQAPKLMTQAMVDHADKIISMGCGVDVAACPAKFLLTEDWGLNDPAGQGLDAVREIRDDIWVRVKAMLDNLSSG